jgi:hypothetical protein
LSVLSHRLIKEKDPEEKDYDSRSERSFSSRSDSHSPRRHRTKNDDFDVERDRSPRHKNYDDFSPRRSDSLKDDERSAPRKFQLDISSPREKEDIYSSLESISDGPLSPPAQRSSKQNDQKGSFVFTKQEKEQPKQSKFDKYDEFDDEFGSERGGREKFEWNNKKNKKYEEFADKYDFDSAPSNDRFYKKDPFKAGSYDDDSFNRKSRFNDDFREEKNNSRAGAFKPKKSLAFVEEEDEIEDEFVPRPSRYQTGKFEYSPKFKSREI